MIKRCTISGREFEVTAADLEFYARMGVPPPTLSPEERQRRRTAFRNFRSLYHRTCSGTGKKIISMYSEQAPFPVFDPAYWWSDNWSDRTYGRELQWSQSFLEQYRSLANAVPRFAILNLKTDNCQYSNFAFESKACYLIFGCVRDEDCLYGHIVWDSKNCVDCLYAYRSQWCSHCIDVVDCYDVHYSTEASNCQESYFLHDCAGCKNCFACTNLRQKQYCFFDQQCTRDEYFASLKRITPLTPDAVENALAWLKHRRGECFYPSVFELQTENITGNHVYESKNAGNCFDTKRAENVKHCYTIFGIENSHDISFTGAPAKFCYDALTMFHAEEVCFSQMISNSHNIAYSEFCYSSHDLFGCIGMRNAEYCILNKQYSKEEYFRLRARIIEQMKDHGEWGEFFNAASSPFAYNESIACEYQPLTREEALQRGLRWKDEKAYDAPSGPVPKVPAVVADAGNDILQQTFYCEATNKPYRIIASELEFHRRMKLPLPRLCPDERHTRRMRARCERALILRKCGQCEADIETAHAEQYARRVLCERCYCEALDR